MTMKKLVTINQNDNIGKSATRFMAAPDTLLNKTNSRDFNLTHLVKTSGLLILVPYFIPPLTFL